MSERRTGNPGIVQAAGDGVVLHQPLKRQILVKNGDFRQNMNGIPVSLFRKTENAPTQGPPKRYFWGLLFDIGIRVSRIPTRLFLFLLRGLSEYKRMNERVNDFYR